MPVISSADLPMSAKGTALFNRVIVGVDERHGEHDATALARNLLAVGGELTLARVHVVNPTAVEDAGGDAQPRRRDEPGASPQAKHDQAVRVAVDSSSVGRGLHELAERRRADLLVVGSCQRGLVGRTILADETREALNGAPCAVAVAPVGYAARQGAWSEIGVGYDASGESEHALAVARNLAAELNTTLSAFEAVSLPASLLSNRGATVDESITAFVDQARGRIDALGDIEAHAAYGTPAEELTVYSASLDLLLVGSRGYGPLGRLVLGSTSARLAQTARCALLVLTRGATKRAGSSVEAPPPQVLGSREPARNP